VTFVVDIQCHLVLSCTTKGKHRDATQRRTYTSSRSSGCDQNSPTHHQPSTHEGAQAQLPQSAACNAISPARRSHPCPYHRTPWPHSMENQKVRPQKIKSKQNSGARAALCHPDNSGLKNKRIAA